MHLVIPYASVAAPEGRALLRGLTLPALQALLAHMAPAGAPPSAGAPANPHDTPDAALSLSPPHETLLAAALGLPAAPDGRIPWAAYFSVTGAPSPEHLLAQPAGDNRRAQAVPAAWFTPCHWQIGMDQVRLLAPEALALSEDDSRALLAALAPLAREDGIELVFETPLRWRAEGELFRDLACASLDRVIGRSLTDWLPQGPGAALLRRLQSEAQMLFYTHPVSDARAARGLLAVNSFWVSGSGALAGSPTPPAVLPQVAWDLREPALQGDWAAWAQAWQALDQTRLAPLLTQLKNGGSLTLSLCGEAHARSWHGPARLRWTDRARQWLRGIEPAWNILDTL